MFDSHVNTCGGQFSGETKFGITLRILAGGDVLDLGVLFDISSSHCTTIMLDVLKHWVNETDIGKINIYDYLADDVAMKKCSIGFSNRSNGILKGAIGALDGWLVRIQRPSFYWDDMTNITTFYSRKGFYALNVQVYIS